MRAALAVLTCLAFAGVAFAGAERESPTPQIQIEGELSGGYGEYPPFLSFVDGLHVTGTPIEVDIETYRLQIDGLVEREASFTFDEIRSMEAESIDMVLECPGTFIDQGTWTGVQLQNLLAPLGIRPDATEVRFHSIDESYSLAIDLEQLDGNVLVAWAFNGEEFPVYHGYPLRICADGIAGAYWVKWLGRIEVM